MPPPFPYLLHARDEEESVRRRTRDIRRRGGMRSGSLALRRCRHVIVSVAIDICRFYDVAMPPLTLTMLRQPCWVRGTRQPPLIALQRLRWRYDAAGLFT